MCFSNRYMYMLERFYLLFYFVLLFYFFFHGEEIVERVPSLGGGSVPLPWGARYFVIEDSNLKKKKKKV